MLDFENIIRKNELSDREMARQYAIAQENIELLFRRMGHVPKALVKTFGCQGNLADSEKMMGLLALMGCEKAEGENDADIIICNTCAVRENAESRLVSMIGQLRRIKQSNPKMIIAVCGCMMQQEQAAQKIYKTYPFVNLIFGTHRLHALPELINRTLTQKRRVVDCYEGENRENIIAEGLPTKRGDSVTACVQIMYGCDNFCSYCIVPYVRGREVSRRPDEILKEVNGLISDGCKEILLLGQNVNSYGKGLDEKIDFAELLRRIEAVPGDFRIRFMTSHPKDCTKELIDLIAASKKICRSIHLPVQCGSDRILGLMNRRYTREHYLSLINYAKKVMPDISFTTDIIVGFPGESYEDFLQTVSLCREVGYRKIYTFVYSKRSGTKAEKLPDPVSYKEKTRWLSELVQVQNEISDKLSRSMEGSTQRVLVEHPSTAREGFMVGRCASGMIVLFPPQSAKPGEFADVLITKGHRHGYEGILSTGRIK